MKITTTNNKRIPKINIHRLRLVRQAQLNGWRKIISIMFIKIVE